MEELITSGRAIDVILALVLAEALALAAYRRLAGGGPPAARWLPNLLSGAALLLALRLALGQAWWGWLAACLLLALVAHLVDLAARWSEG